MQPKKKTKEFLRKFLLAMNMMWELFNPICSIIWYFNMLKKSRSMLFITCMTMLISTLLSKHYQSILYLRMIVFSGACMTQIQHSSRGLIKHNCHQLVWLGGWILSSEKARLRNQILEEAILSTHSWLMLPNILIKWMSSNNILAWNNQRKLYTESLVRSNQLKTSKINALLMEKAALLAWSLRWPFRNMNKKTRMSIFKSCLNWMQVLQELCSTPGLMWLATQSGWSILMLILSSFPAWLTTIQTESSNQTILANLIRLP